MSDLEGVLIVDKPGGPTSHDIVARLRQVSGQRRIGHAGTLDPLATGVLPLVLGAATRFVRYLPSDPKVYRVEAILGLTTTTGDIEGEPTARTASLPDIRTEAIAEALARLEGESEQLPPMFSARKVKGQPLYRAARRGLEIDRPRTRVNIYSARLIRHQRECLEILVECSPGTYVRTLITDLGQQLGTGATVTALARLRSGAFSITQALPLAELDSAAACAAALVPLDGVPLNLPEIGIDEALAQAFCRGQAVPLPAAGTTGDEAAVRDPARRLVGVGRIRTGSDGRRMLHPSLVRSSTVKKTSDITV